MCVSPRLMLEIESRIGGLTYSLGAYIINGWMQEKKYSLEELQEMLVEMSQGLELKMESAGGVWLLDGAAASRRSSKRARWESSASPTTLDTTHLLSPTCTVQSWNC
uniref:Uncharacterized protein n=1 Tax=Nelumbo nucifera TaxID=4432 RepID=A0A822YNA4_NELNU|nr:TPA_asm: hypothetical protein HUJ06_006294 [Nelumbo nucifera]